MTEKSDEIKERIAKLKADGKLSAEAEALLDELIVEFAEMERSNRALRKAALKAAGTGDVHSFARCAVRIGRSRLRRKAHVQCSYVSKNTGPRPFLRCL